MDLKSRLLFLDTCVYEGKNFQFLTHSLGGLHKLIEAGEVRLLITDITIGEVRKHIKRKAEEAVKALKVVKKQAMILRNLPELPCHAIFTDVSIENIEQGLLRNFDVFLESHSVEVVPVDSVNPSYVFDRYFKLLPPFAVGDKEKEFADAFVLKALLDASLLRQHFIHIISTDRDVSRFASEHPSLIWSESIDSYIDAVNKAVSIEPAVFADEAFAAVRGELMNIAHECICALSSEFLLGGHSLELDNLEVYEIQLIKASLIEVSRIGCVYEVAFSFMADTVAVEKDYDRSPFDPDEGSYLYVLENIYERTFKGEVSFRITISYQDKLIETVELFDYDPPSFLQVSAPIREVVRYLEDDF